MCPRLIRNCIAGHIRGYMYSGDSWKLSWPNHFKPKTSVLTRNTAFSPKSSASMIDFPKSTQQQSYFQGHVAREKCVKPPRCENWRRERLRITLLHIWSYICLMWIASLTLGCMYQCESRSINLTLFQSGRWPVGALRNGGCLCTG